MFNSLLNSETSSPSDNDDEDYGNKHEQRKRLVFSDRSRDLYIFKRDITKSGNWLVRFY